MAINKVVYGNTTLIDLTGDTVASENMLQGTTAHAANGSAVTGTIITKTSSALSASDSIVTVPSGYYATQATKAVASAVQATPTITVSAAGLITATTTQSAGYVAAGSKSATKQLTAKAAATYTPSTKNQTIASGQYLKGVQTIKGDANLVAANIKNNVSIFGIKGTYETPAYAVIGVIYPAGSTCTCTDGSKTLKLKDTSGQGFFLIPQAGTWTVKATDGTNTKSQSVKITSKGQSKSVKLNYGIFLIRNGVVQSNTFSVFNGTPKTFETVGSVFRVAVSTSTISAYFNNKIDFSNISSIKIALAGGRTAYNLTFGLINTKTAFNPVTSDNSNDNIFNIASVVFTSGTFSATTKSIGVSGISGSYYLGFTLDYTNAMNDAKYGNGGFDIADIELIEVK